MNLLNKIKRDLQKELKASIAFIKEGTAVIRKKAKEMTKEELRRYKIIELKTKVKEQMAGLGGRIYDLGLNYKNPMQDKKVIALFNRIKKLEMQTTKLEKQSKTSVKKVSKKRPLKRASKK
jgi:hypothetical protein